MTEAFSGDLGRYEIGEVLGRPGGWGAAYAAERDDGIHCVVKLIHGMQNPQPEELERLRIVLARLTTVNSPHVVRVIDFGVDRSGYGAALPWIAMPRQLGARALQEVLWAPDPPKLAWARRVIAGVAAGLAALREAGLLHRDLKPGNILVDARGRAWLIDFELIKVLGLTTRTRRTHEPLGTPLYMAPEQLVGPVVPASDLWALGLVIHELLTGEHPLDALANQRSETLIRAINSPGLVSDAVPEPYRPLVSALLRKIPTARPADAGTVVRWLEDPSAVSLDPPETSGTPGIRWSVAGRRDFDAAEQGSADHLEVHSIDVRNQAAGDVARLRRASARLDAALAFEPRLDKADILPLYPALEQVGDEVERAVLTELTTTSDGAHTETLLPFAHTDEGAELAVHTTRVGVRHRDTAAGRLLIGTIRCRAALLEDPGRASELLAGSAALGVDAWRLIVEGLEPGCGSGTMRAARDAAEALACGGRPVWLMAGGLARWIALATPGVGLCYRAGRELWIGSRGSGGPQPPERVEVDLLAGPIPRQFAERLAAARPELLRCSCPICSSSPEALPAPGVPTIVHNLAVVGAQVRAAQSCDQSALRGLVAEAAALRGEIAELLGWHAEIDDARRVLEVLGDPERALDPRPHLLLTS